MSRRSTGRHRKSRMPSRRTLSVVTGAAGLVVAVTTGAVPVPLVSPGDAHEGGDARAEPATLYVDSGAPSGAPQDETGQPAGSDSGEHSVPGTSETPTARPTASSQASTPAQAPRQSQPALLQPGAGRRGPGAEPAVADAVPDLPRAAQPPAARPVVAAAALTGGRPPVDLDR